MKYECRKSKQEILNTVVGYFNEVKEDISADMDNIGKYKAMIELLARLEIHEVEKNDK